MPDIIFDFTTGVLDPGFVFTRTTVGYYFNSAGVLTQAAINAPRIPAYNPVTLENIGIVIEGSATNSVRNNTMVGAVAGSPGTFPAQWAVDGDGNGLLRTVVGTGQEDGIDYVDVRYAGTPVATGVISVSYMTYNELSATAAQAFYWSCFYRLMAGSIANAVFNECYTASDGTAAIGDNAVPFVPTGAKLRTQRIGATGNLSAFPALTRIVTRLRVDVTAGQPVDFTIRIGLPQLNGGANLAQPMKTTAAALTCAPDVLLTNSVPWYNPVEGTLIADFLSSNSSNVYIATLSDGTATNDQRLQGGLVGVIYQVFSSTVLQVNLSVVVPGRSPTQRLLAALGYKENDCNFACNGILTAKDTVCLLPLGINKFNVGSASNNSGQGFGAIKKITYLATRVSDEQLVALTSDPQLWVGAVLVSNKPAIRIVKV